MRIVEYVHQELAKQILPGDLAIDATIGNGHDTLFLAQKGARVIGFDIQESAIHTTRHRLEEAGLAADAMLHLLGHQNMLDVIPNSWISQVKIAMFNLGYLPGSDKTIITTQENTLKALDATLKLLKKDGLLSIVLYPDHPGGSQESESVLAWIETLNPYPVTHYNPNSTGPQWLLVKKLRLSSML